MLLYCVHLVNTVRVTSDIISDVEKTIVIINTAMPYGQK